MTTMLKDVDEVRFIIENSFEDIKVERIRLIGSGNDCHAYEINGNMVFEFDGVPLSKALYGCLSEGEKENLARERVPRLSHKAIR